MKIKSEKSLNLCKSVIQTIYDIMKTSESLTRTALRTIFTQFYQFITKFTHNSLTLADK